MKIHRFIFIIFLLLLAGCTTTRNGNLGDLQTFPIHTSEPEWIRGGEPMEFEGDLWYPQDGVEVFLDSEVMYMGEYRGTQFFVDKVDVRPFERLYTKFAKNKFRYFEKRAEP